MANTYTEEYLGSDCSGSSGEVDRTLTISNTGTTSNNGFLVSISGLNLSNGTEYTIVHNSSSSVITFLNALWDDQLIVVNYIQQIIGSGSQATSDDFINGPLADFGVTVTRTPVTTTTDFHGDKTYTDGTDEDIDVVFENPKTKYGLDKSGLLKNYDARIFAKIGRAHV